MGTAKNGLEAISYCAPELWLLFPEEIKSLSSYKEQDM